VSNPLVQLAAGWERFWFTPQPTSTLGVFRIGFGLLVTGWTLTLAPNLLAFYGPDGILPTPLAGPRGSWGILGTWHGSAAVVVVFAFTLSAAVALTVGLFSRIAAVVVLVGVISLEQRNLLVTNSGDALVRNLAFFCALAPSGEALSIDRLRKVPDRFWEFPARAPWALRLVQIQLSIGYLSAVWHKAGNDLWRNGSAVSYALRMQDIHRVPTPGFITHSVVLTELLTFGTLALELSLAILVWNRAARPWVLLAGVTLHLSIDFSILVGFFSYGMLCGYLAFVSPEASSRLVLGVRGLVLRRRQQQAGVATTSEVLTNRSSEASALQTQRCPETPDIGVPGHRNGRADRI
jgi:uncharacterized protein (UPF0548 family)